MPEKSGMFDTTADDPREYAARDFAEYFGRLITNGVFNAGQYLNVSASGTDANVSLSPGAAWINGYAYSVYDSALTLPFSPATTQDRIDRIILRLDTSTPVRAIRALVLQGTPGSNPSAPNLVRSGSIYDLSLAKIRVVANSTIILPANITDERLDNSVCGLVNSLVKVDTTIFQQQWDAYMATLQSAGYVTGATFNAHLADNTAHVYYSDDSGTANAKVVAITPVPTTYKKGLAVAFTNLVQNTGAVTINVNGLGPKSVLKSNGNALTSGNLKVNSIYTVRYNGTAFILQGEGGGGNATAEQILAGATATTDVGDIAGTMVNQGAKILTPSTSNVSIPAGYHNGSGYVSAYIPGKKFASGTITSSGTVDSFPNYGGTLAQSQYLSFDFANLPFAPSRVEFTRTDRSSRSLGSVWHVSNYYSSGSEYANSSGGAGNAAYRIPYSKNIVKIPVDASSVSYDWVAYE